LLVVTHSDILHKSFLIFIYTRKPRPKYKIPWNRLWAKHNTSTCSLQLRPDFLTP